MEVLYDVDPNVENPNADPSGLGAGDEFARTFPVEEERVLLRDPSSISGWRAWRPQDYYNFSAMTSGQKRVLVRGSTEVPGSTLPKPGGGDRLCTLLGFGRCGSYFGPPRFHSRPVYLGCPPRWIERGTPYTPYPILRGEAWTQKELDTYLLLLCEDGTHGLDLSFVTHLFIVHRIGDPALVSQVVSRAHRMGADPHIGVQVQTLHLFDEVTG